MIYLLWGLLNITLFLSFIIICFKATKVIRVNIGLFASIIFIFGLLSFISIKQNRTGDIENSSNHTKIWKFANEADLKNNYSSSLDIILEKTLVSSYQLAVIHGKDKVNNINVPISAYSSVEGFVGGTVWKPLSIIVNKTNDVNKFEYIVSGVLEWKLLGAKVYTQAKYYKGLVFIN